MPDARAADGQAGVGKHEGVQEAMQVVLMPDSESTAQASFKTEGDLIYNHQQRYTILHNRCIS